MSEKTKGPREIAVREEPIELCQLLKFAGLAGSGGEAKTAITEERVTVNGVLETRKRRKLRAGDVVEMGGERLVVRLG
jgi:ribosome-associated protein